MQVLLFCINCMDCAEINTKSSHIVRINIHELHKIAYKAHIENDYQNKA